MIRLVTLIVAIALQIVATAFAIRLVKTSLHRKPWIFISLGFVAMSINLIIKLMEFLCDDFSFYLRPIGDWLNVLIPLLLVVGVILVGKMFFAQNCAHSNENSSDNCQKWVYERNK